MELRSHEAFRFVVVHEVDIMRKNVLEVIQETEILGKKIKMYGSVDHPWFFAGDVADWIEERDGYTVSRKVDNDEKQLHTICVGGQNREVTMLTEDGLYEACMQSRKPIAKQMKKEIKRYLKAIRLTGAAIAPNEEARAVDYYFANFSDDLKLKMVKELEQKNQQLLEEIKGLEEDWKTFTDCKGTYSINQVAHFIGVGEYKLFSYLRNFNILFRNEDGDNIPYENPVNKSKFIVVPAIAPDGTLHSQTRVYPIGMKYILGKLRKAGILQNGVA